ncbi:MAG: chorismate-binding protein, partial [Gemmatimonadetes bacterium]|nr:chorismate-binding protein [Gemmatimonadota bacterium]
MRFRPSFDEFLRLAASFDGAPGLVPVWREFLFDVDTAVTAYHKWARPPFGFLLESVVGGEQWARYSFVGTRPAGAWRLSRGRVSWWSPDEGWADVECDDPLADLDARLQARRPAEVPGLPRFWGGAVGYFAYDVVRQIERLPDSPPDDLEVPDGIFLFTDIVLAIDNLRGRAMAIASVPVDPGDDEAALRERYADAEARIEELVGALAEEPGPGPLELREEPEGDPPFTSATTREDYEAGVERIRDYVRAGDAFQVVLSQRLGMDLTASPFDLYRAVRTLNPSPYLYFLELDGVTLVGSSPEVLVRLEDGTVTVRPIAGTRPRGSTPEEDRALAAELAADEKELAEHRMLVDLGRNDVGRVARFGSVTVPDLMVVERYSHVMHLVSQVEGQLADERSAVDVFRACFPAGTVSGAPKIRAMEIIGELEQIQRGPYSGAVAYIGFNGNLDSCITIRTVLLDGEHAYV